jgi:3-deoxy-7-phosphoheptulonate synthase
MPATVYVGLAVTSHNPSAVATATISNVAVSKPTSNNTAPTVSISAPAAGTSYSAPASMTISATAGDTDGSITNAINAIKAAAQPHTFLGINLDGSASAIVTRGNPDCHVVLRGGATGPNYSSEHNAKTEQLLAKAGLPKAILVDASHDNSAKQPERQPDVVRELLAQISRGNTSIMGAMIESNLEAGNQAFPQARDTLRYGVSITDACIDWDTTETLLRETHALLG